MDELNHRTTSTTPNTKATTSKSITSQHNTKKWKTSTVNVMGTTVETPQTPEPAHKKQKLSTEDDLKAALIAANHVEPSMHIPSYKHLSLEESRRLHHRQERQPSRAQGKEPGTDRSAVPKRLMQPTKATQYRKAEKPAFRSGPSREGWWMWPAAFSTSLQPRQVGRPAFKHGGPVRASSLPLALQARQREQERLEKEGMGEEVHVAKEAVKKEVPGSMAKRTSSRPALREVRNVPESVNSFRGGIVASSKVSRDAKETHDPKRRLEALLVNVS